VIEYGGQPVRGVRKAFERAVKRARLENVSPHVLRHTAAVWMAENGVSMEKVAELLGDSLAVAHRNYARFSLTYMADAVGALEL